MILSMVALGSSLVVGWCLLHRVRGVAALPLAFRAALALGVGTAASSLLYFAALALGMASPVPVALMDLALLATAVALYVRRPREEREADGMAERPSRLWWGAVGVAGALQLAAALARYRAEPLGFWDAFAIWNLKARFFSLEAGEHWERAFSSIITWSHTDYPLLLPGGVARLWTYAGEPSSAIPAVYSVVFYLATAALAYGALEKWAGRRAAALGGLALLATPAYAGQSVWQVADIPLSFALLGTLALLVFAKSHDAASYSLGRLAGFFAGIGALTKNEGLLFAVAILAVLLLARRGRAHAHESGLWIAYVQGAAFPILVLAVMKFGYGGESDLASDFGAHSLARVFEWERHAMVLTSFARTLVVLTGWPLLGVLTAGALASRFVGTHRGAAGAGLAALVLAIQLLGYYGVYLITERDLAWHLGTSNLRLFVQLWPSALLLYFAVLFNEIDESRTQASSRFA